MRQTFLAQHFFQRPYFQVIPEIHQTPRERTRVFKEETEGVIPCKFNLIFFQLVGRNTCQNFFKGGVVFIPRIWVKGEAAPAIMGLSAGDDGTAIHGGFESDGGGVCQANIGYFDQIVGVDFIQCTNDMNIAGKFRQGFAHDRSHGPGLRDKFFTGMYPDHQLHIGSPGKVLDCLRDPFSHRGCEDITSESETIAQNIRGEHHDGAVIQV